MDLIIDILTDDGEQYIGFQEMKALFVMNDYLEGQYLETTFLILILPEPANLDDEGAIRPIFDLEGISLDQYIVWGKGWEFDLPAYTH